MATRRGLELEWSVTDCLARGHLGILAAPAALVRNGELFDRPMDLLRDNR